MLGHADHSDMVDVMWPVGNIAKTIDAHWKPPQSTLVASLRLRTKSPAVSTLPLPCWLRTAQLSKEALATVRAALLDFCLQKLSRAERAVVRSVALG